MKYPPEPLPLICDATKNTNYTKLDTRRHTLAKSTQNAEPVGILVDTFFNSKLPGLSSVLD